jgi:hypothetical protein
MEEQLYKPALNLIVAKEWRGFTRCGALGQGLGVVRFYVTIPGTVQKRPCNGSTKSALTEAVNSRLFGTYVQQFTDNLSSLFLL